MSNNVSVLDKELMPRSQAKTNIHKFIPRCDIYETDKAIVVLADMPGVDENQIDVTIEKNILTIKGNIQEPEYANYNLIYSEYKTGNYERVFALSDEVNKDEIQACLKNGVLKLMLPKSPVAMARKITVKAE